MIGWKKWGSWILFSFASKLKADEGKFAVPDVLKNRIGLAHRNAGPEKPAPQHQQVLKLSIGGESYGNLNPCNIMSAAQTSILTQIFDGLLRRNIQGKFEGACAESWSYDSENFTWTFKLRPNLKWSNGEKLTAHHFVLGIRSKFDPETYPHRVVPDAVYSNLLKRWNLKNAKSILEGKADLESLGVSALDDRTLKLEWTEDCNPELCYERFTAPSLCPLYPGYIQKLQIAQGAQDYKNLVTNGSFKLSSLVLRSGITLKKNVEHWDAHSVFLEEVNYHHHSGEWESVKAWQNGQVDISFSLDAEGLQLLKPADYSYLSTYCCSNSLEMEFNLKFLSVKDRRVRQAINLVLDRKALGKLFVLPPSAELYVFGNGEGTRPEWADWSMERRIAEAKKLMKEAGYHKGNKLKLTLSLLRWLDSVFLKGVVGCLYALDEFVELKTQPYEVQAFSAVRRKPGMEFCISLFSRQDFLSFGQYLNRYSNGTPNIMNFENVAYDRAIEAFKKAKTLHASEQALRKLEAILLEEVPAIPLFAGSSHYLVHTNVGGWEASHNSPICPSGNVMCRFLFKKVV